MNLKSLDDNQLLSATLTAAQESRTATAKLLHHLYEVDRRRLYARGKYDSLFAYCTEALKLSSSEAALRVNAVRVMREVPNVAEKVETGELNLTAVAQAQTVFNREARAGKRFPKEKKRQILVSIENVSTREAQKIIFAQSTLPPEEVVEKVRMVSESATQITFGASPELVKSLEDLKQMWGLATYAELFEKMAKVVEEKTVVKVTRARESKAKGRYIGEGVKRQVRERDENCCVHVDPESGRRCRSKYRLQLDHIVPFARGREEYARELAAALFCAQSKICGGVFWGSGDGERSCARVNFSLIELTSKF